MMTKLRGFMPVILALALCAGARYAWAQGQVNFANNVSNRVVNCLTGGFVTNGSTFRAALYFAPDGVTDEASFVQAGANTTFTLPGIYNGGVRTVPAAPGTSFMFQVRVWETAYGATWEAAAAAGPISCRWPILGKSAIIRVVTTGSPDPPATIPNPSFTVCPNSCVGVTCSSNIFVITNNPSGAAVTYTVSSTNVCCPSSTNTVLTCSPPSGSVFPPGTNVVNCTISDGIGPSNTCFFLVVIRVPATRYVSLTGSHTSPFTNWAGAATNIQAAVNVSIDGDNIVVTNGTYRLQTNVLITKALSMRSVNGTGVTFIDAQYTNRCIFASNELAVIDGFTIRNGRAIQSSSDSGDGGGIYLVGGTVQNCVISNCMADVLASRRGGGVYMIGGLLTNSFIINNGNGQGQHAGGGVYCVSTGRIDLCQLRGNATEYWGGGVYMLDGVLTRSWISDNLAGDYGGGVYALRSTVSECIVSNNIVDGGYSFGPDGGGIYLGSGQLDRSMVISNTAGISGRGGYGGGVYSTNGVVRNSLIVGNRSKNSFSPGLGGGVYLKSASLWSSTVSGNVSEQGSGAVFVETYGTVTNSIIYFNAAATNVNWSGIPATFDHVSTTPDPGGLGNTTSPPLFVNTNAFDYRLAPGSPCIDTGINQAWMVGAKDLKGNPRIINGTVDIGACESTCLLPAIVQQPGSQTNCASSSVLFTVSIVGSPSQYQWQLNQTNLADGPTISGATSSNLSVYNLTPADAGNYRVLITNFCGGVTSAPASLT
ncbi:MAG TPA: immunoglobulin domain-containing protein, partial [Candidatus Binatia bacterium]|nr:immunoglobulin domain-containing protein [Candidatus Binatia bacterium]